MKITLLDGEHDLKPPTFYALVLMDDYGVDFESTEPRSVTGMLAAILTDSERMVDGEPEKVWTPTMVAKVIDPAKLDVVLAAVTELLLAAFPDPKEDSTRPTKA